MHWIPISPQASHHQRNKPLQAYRAYDPYHDENFDAAGDSVDEADWERASAILLEGTSVSPPPPRPRRQQQQQQPARRRGVAAFDALEIDSPEFGEFYNGGAGAGAVPLSSGAGAAAAGAGAGTALALRQRSASDRPSSSSSWFARFVGKLHAAWVIFFPRDSPRSGGGRRRGGGDSDCSARDAGLNRLKVVLVADRVGMTPESFEEMKRSIVDALGRYVELSSDGDVQVSVSQDEAMGAVYSVSVPVRRVRQEARFALLSEGGSVLDADGVTVAWDEEEGGGGEGEGGEGGAGDRAAAVASDVMAYDEDNWDSDPSSRFPYGA